MAERRLVDAGATPPVGSLLEQSWDGFSTNWNVDVRQVFNFTRAAAAAPLSSRDPWSSACLAAPRCADHR